MPFCTACGTQNNATSRFCVSCGQPMSAAVPPVPQPQTTRGNSGLRTATMVICLIAAFVLFFGGIAGCTTGAFFEGVEEVFEEEVDESSQGSTTEEVFEAGAWAIVVSIVLFIGGGLARVATKTSLFLLVVAMPMLIGVIALDTWSVFAVAYYLSTLMTGVGVILMALAYRRGPPAVYTLKSRLPIRMEP